MTHKTLTRLLPGLEGVGGTASFSGGAAKREGLRQEGWSWLHSAQVAQVAQVGGSADSG